jgi:hypothetical protein
VGGGGGGGGGGGECRLLCFLKACAILQFGGMELHPICLPNEPVHVARFGGEDFGVLALDVMVMV